MFRPVLIALCVFCMGARPYEDTKKRFKISLPDEWTLAPAFGDTFGMTFERKLPKKSERLTLVVHVDPTDATGLDNFADQIATSLENNGHRSTGRGFGKVGDREAVFRDFDKDGQQQSRSYFFQDQGHFFHVRFASPSGAWRQARREMVSILGSFETQVSARAAPSVESPGSRAVVGYWKSAKGVPFILAPTGRFRLASLEGRYELDGETLELRPVRGKTKRFKVRVEGQTLMLSSPKMKRPARYERVDPEEETKRLIGTWQAKVAGGPLVLDLQASGSFSLGREKGRWAYGDGTLTLTAESGAQVVYLIEQKDAQLEVRGGDLDGPVTFRKLGGR